MKSIFLILSISFIWFSLREMFQELYHVFKSTGGGILYRLGITAKAMVSQALSCGKCFTFYVALLISFNPILSAGASALFDLYERIKNKLS